MGSEMCIRDRSMTTKKLTTGMFSVAMIVVGFAVAVAVNMVVKEMPSSWTAVDATSTKLYSLTDTTKDYVKNPKKSGYQSIHVIAGVPVTYNDTVTEIRVEIQIRSFAMDYWAELDTQMCYKKDAGQIANVERETRGYSDVIAKVDNKMLELRRQIEMM